jgi:hypothetical protein
MIPTTLELERTAALPTTAPAGRVAVAAAVCTRRSHAPASFASACAIEAGYRSPSTKQWPMQDDRPLGSATGRPPRHLGSLST